MFRLKIIQFETIGRIRNELDKFSIVYYIKKLSTYRPRASVDKTTDARGRYVGNFMVGKLFSTKNRISSRTSD